MFSKQDRFEELCVEGPGPGTYDVPSTLDAKGCVLEAQHWENWSPEEKISPSPVTPPEKENRQPAAARSPRLRGEQRCKDLRLASQLDLVRDELKQKSKEAKELQIALAAKDRKIEELAKKIEDSAADRREAHRRAAEAENEMGSKRRQIHEKDQEILGLQRKLEHSRLATKEWTKRVEKQEEEQRNAQSDMLHMRQSLDALQEQLTSVGRDQVSAEQGLREHQERSAELEAGLKAHIEVLQEQLLRETARRKDLEESQLQESEGSAKALSLCNDLQGKISDLEMELGQKEILLKQREHMEEELRTLRAEVEENDKQAHVECPEGQDELEARALRAEAEAEEARLMLERWKEWGDEQQLRELSAEAERLERLKQVREEVSQQVEAARQELVAENRTLQKRIVELEKGHVKTQLQEAEALDALEAKAEQSQVEALASREKQQELHAQLAEAAGRTKATEEKLAESVRKLEAARAQVAAERSSLEAEQAARRLAEEKVATLEEAVVEAASHIADGQSRVVCMRWQHFTESAFLSWRYHAWKEAASLRPRKHNAAEEELERLDRECEELREQNAQVLLTLQLQQQDLESALAETRRLAEREAAYEEDVLRISERSAELGGHANPKQKIKHLMAIKEENQTLRQELKRSQQTAAQLQGQLRAAQFSDSLPRRAERSEGKVAREARAHQRASERATHAYQHLYTLVERALASDAIDLSLAIDSEKPLEQEELYRRLRALSFQAREA